METKNSHFKKGEIHIDDLNFIIKNNVININNNNEQNKKNIQKEILAFINENIETVNNKTNTVESNSLFNSNISKNIENDESIKNYNGERLTLINQNEFFFPESNFNTEKNLIKSDDFSDRSDINEGIDEKKINNVPKIFERKNIVNINDILTANKSNYISTIDTIQTSTISNKNNKIDENNLQNYIKNNIKDFTVFFNEIGLNLKYIKNLIENGFDDLKVIIEQTKEVIALSDQNLKEIGIKIPGHRAQILIHLEEKAQIIPYILQDEIIYNKNINIIKKEDSIDHFLNSINLICYKNNFLNNGYNNSCLLFSQMLTRQPLTDDILKNDLDIQNKKDRNKILVALFAAVKIYTKKLKSYNNKTLYYNGKNNMDICELCLIF